MYPFAFPQRPSPNGRAFRDFNKFNFVPSRNIFSRRSHHHRHPHREIISRLIHPSTRPRFQSIDKEESIHAVAGKEDASAKRRGRRRMRRRRDE